MMLQMGDERMEAIRVEVLTGDRDYALALCRAISRSRRNFIVSYKQGGQTQNYESTAADFVLTDFSEEEFYKDFSPAQDSLKNDAPVPVFLREMDVIAGSADGASAPICFYKYGNVKELCDMLLSMYCLRHGRSFFGSLNQNCRLISVTADKGGCGKTCFSLALAQELRRFRGKRVLYMSFSPFESTELYLPCPEEKKRAFQEILYYFFKGQEISLEGALLKDAYGVEILPPAIGINPLSSLDEKQLESFLGYVCGCGMYEAVICDMAGSFTETEMYVLEASDNVCLISGGERLKAYLGLALGGEEKLLEPQICHDSESVRLREGRLFISIDADYGEDVKKFAENFIN